jgi:hypothetical protein
LPCKACASAYGRQCLCDHPALLHRWPLTLELAAWEYGIWWVRLGGWGCVGARGEELGWWGTAELTHAASEGVTISVSGATGSD